MTLIDMVSMAFMNLWRRKLRSVLTMLGMVIGTTSIVVMVSLGLGINYANEQAILGNQNITIIKVRQNYDQSAKKKKLDDLALRDLKKLSNVLAVMPMARANGGLVKTGKYMSGMQLFGVDWSIAAEFGITAEKGEMPQKGTKENPQVLFSQDMPQNYFDPKSGTQAIDKNGNPKVDPLVSATQLTFDYSNVADVGIQITEGPPKKKGAMYKLKVTGIMPMNNEFWYSVFMDKDVLAQLSRDNKEFMYVDSNAGKYESIWIKADDMDNVLDLVKQIKEMGYMPESPLEYIEQMQESTKQLSALLGAIGAVSMFVAAIGIANTMLMSIYERTKEIGVIKVLGCSMGNILFMFLLEAVYIGFLGGMLGVGFSYAISYFGNSFFASMGFTSIIPAWLAAGSLLFSAIVAMISGLYPATRAVKLSPLEAIRTG